VIAAFGSEEKKKHSNNYCL